MKMVAYIRVSTDKQAESGLGLESQREQILAYAKLFDIEVISIWTDAGKSAGSLDRTGLNKALSMLEKGAAEGMVVLKLDRLTRSVVDLGQLIEAYFTRYRLVSVRDHIDTDSASGRLILNVLTSVSQWEREVTSERTKDALLQLKQNGKRYSGLAPYGKMFDESGNIINNAHEQYVIKSIRTARQSGMSLEKIAHDMLVTNRKGKRFTPSSIHRILKVNP